MTYLERIAATMPRKYHFCVSDFALLARSGAFQDYAKTELIEGEILAVNAIHSRHAKIQARMVALLSAVTDPLVVYANPSVLMDDESVPEPDIVLAEDHSEDFLPVAKVRIAIEISDSTLDQDLGRKASLYARHGVPEYWVVDVDGRVIHQMWQPVGEAYGGQRIVTFGNLVKSMAVAGLCVTTDTLN